MNAEQRVGLTERGRIRAVLVALEQGWDGLTPEQQAEALALVERLAACYRRPPVRVPLVGKLAV